MSPLAPGILIAAPPLGDPNFDRSVVLLASHDSEGSFGWIINGEVVLSIAELLEQAAVMNQGEVAPTGVKGLVHRGGPVSPSQVWLVYPSAHLVEGIEPQLEVAPGISATASRDFLLKLAAGHEIPHLRAFAGYAGWGAGQLEAEIGQGAWLPGSASSDLIFETSPEEIWQAAYAKLGLTPLSFSSQIVGKA